MSSTSAVSSSSSPTMSAQDVQSLSLVSQELSWDVRASIVEMTTFGFYLILCVTALYNILRRREKTRRGWLLLAALLFTFAMTTITTSTHLVRVIAKIQTILIDNTNLSFLERVATYNHEPWIGPSGWIEFIIMCGGDSGLMFMINDVLAIWRAVSVWTSGSPTLMKILLYFFWAANFILWIPTITFEFLELNRGVISHGYYISTLAITCSSLSIAVNALATFMIGFTAFRYMRAEASRGVRFQGATVLLMLAESGVLYFIIQVIRLGLSCSITADTPFSSTLYATNRVFISLSFVLTAMYTPTLILIINHGCSIADTVQIVSSAPRAQPKASGRKMGSVSNIVFAGRRTLATQATMSVASHHGSFATDTTDLELNALNDVCQDNDEKMTA